MPMNGYKRDALSKRMLAVKLLGKDLVMRESMPQDLKFDVKETAFRKPRRTKLALVKHGRAHR
jgi:hypothetical protein